MLEDVEWGEFRVGDLLEKIKTKKLPFKADELPKKKIGKYTLPCLTSSFNNQGLNYFVPREGATILKNVISIPSNSDVYRAYFQSNEFTVLSDAYALQWNVSDIELSPKQYLFVVQCINKITDLHIYSYKNKLGGWNVVKNKYIKLPISKGKIDFNFMEDFIAELEAERIAELEAYLTVAGLKDYNLTQEEQQALDNYNDLIFNVFNVIDVFDVKNTSNILARDIKQNSGNTPYLCASSENNGVSSYISYDNRFLEKGGCIFIGGKTFVVSYQGRDFYSNDSHNLTLRLKGENGKAKLTQLYLATCVHKSLNHKYSWGDSISNTKIQKDTISLPSKNNKPEFSSMEIIISAIQKLVIKDVVQYADRKIALHRQVVKSGVEKV
ncbi:restriction endonuclease subunit S [Lelliottia sp. SL45]|uniref:restriction endonuclease subunit S n=1 Tax=Lelliottia sp. SL45 TaxID=2994665 RepID=UPI00227333EB|nr:restriction endonuclease subunit S [Lelliottia sp. SL45]MCY1698074.1 restriction endonuclease subunit S [Lelliottia sp. SL45]